MSRRYAYGDEVAVVVLGNVEAYDEYTARLHIDYDAEHGPAESSVATDSAAVFVLPADAARTEYAVRITSRSPDGPEPYVRGAAGGFAPWNRGRAEAEVEYVETNHSTDSDAVIVTRTVVTSEWAEETE